MATCFLSDPRSLRLWWWFFYIILLEPFGFVSWEQKFDNLLTMVASEACWKEMCVRVGMGIWQMQVDLWARLDGRIIYSQCELLAITDGNRKCACHITCVWSLLAASVVLMGIRFYGLTTKVSRLCLVSCCKRTSDLIGFRRHDGDSNSERLIFIWSAPFWNRLLFLCSLLSGAFRRLYDGFLRNCGIHLPSYTASRARRRVDTVVWASHLALPRVFVVFFRPSRKIAG
jgi:hypothetical protein